MIAFVEPTQEYCWNKLDVSICNPGTKYRLLRPCALGANTKVQSIRSSIDHWELQQKASSESCTWATGLLLIATLSHILGSSRGFQGYPPRVSSLYNSHAYHFVWLPMIASSHAVSEGEARHAVPIVRCSEQQCHTTFPSAVPCIRGRPELPAQAQ
jgi:hypothetical protein